MSPDEKGGTGEGRSLDEAQREYVGRLRDAYKANLESWRAVQGAYVKAVSEVPEELKRELPEASRDPQRAAELAAALQKHWTAATEAWAKGVGEAQQQFSEEARTAFSSYLQDIQRTWSGIDPDQVDPSLLAALVQSTALAGAFVPASASRSTGQ